MGEDHDGQVPARAGLIARFAYRPPGGVRQGHLTAVSVPL